MITLEEKNWSHYKRKNDIYFNVSKKNNPSFKNLKIYACATKYVIFFLLSGKATLYTYNNTLKISDGTILFIKKNAEIKFQFIGKKIDYALITFDVNDQIDSNNSFINYIGEFKKDISIYKFNEDIYTSLLKKINFFSTLSVDNKESFYFTFIIDLLLNIKEQEDFSYFNFDFINKYSESGTTLFIYLYILDNYKLNITVNSIADKFIISRPYLSLIFKRDYGFSITDLIKFFRLENAKYLLMNTNSKIIDIAQDSGFGSISQFNKIFKETMDCSPRDYRKRGV